MIEYTACIAGVALVVSVGVTLTGIMFHWLRADILRVESKVDGHSSAHVEGKI